MRWSVVLGTFVIGMFGLVLSCIYMENPYQEDQLLYGYPFLWLETSKSLSVQLPPIPKNIIILPGFFADLLLYLSVGLVISYMVFTLNENKMILKFFLKSEAIFLVVSFLAGFILYAPGPTPGAGPIGIGVGLALIFASPAAFICTIAYGYYKIFINWRTKKKIGAINKI